MVVLLLSAGVVFAEESANQPPRAQGRALQGASQGSGPTLAQTSDWIMTRLGESSIIAYVGSTTSGRVKVYVMPVKMAISGCSATFEYAREHVHDGPDGFFADLYRGTVSLQRLAAPTLQPKQEGGVDLVWVVLRSASATMPAYAAEVVSYRDVVSYTQRDDRSAAVASLPASWDLWIPLEDRTLAPRISTAFLHAIQLCGGAKKEPF